MYAMAYDTFVTEYFFFSLKCKTTINDFDILCVIK